jgi:uncharacterized DUF497 family protein
MRDKLGEFSVDRRTYNVYTFKTDIHFLHQGQSFVWDRDKASSNIAKHSSTFEEACQIFFDPFLRVDDAGTGDEERHADIGMTENWLVFCVVHLFREGEIIRIISARVATARERKFYENCQ